MITKLVNLIEIKPYDFYEDDKQIELPSTNHPIAWKEYRQNVWKSSVFTHLPRITSDWYYVDMDDIDEDVIEIIIKNFYSDEDIDMNADYDDYICIFMGGIGVKVGDELPIRPHCCGDIGNIDNWKGMLTNPSKNWQLIWNGHPGTAYRMVGEFIEFVNAKNETDVLEETVKSQAKMRLVDFQSQLETMKQKQTQFKQRVNSKLKQMNYVHADEIANGMCGIWIED